MGCGVRSCGSSKEVQSLFIKTDLKARVAGGGQGTRRGGRNMQLLAHWVFVKRWNRTKGAVSALWVMLWVLLGTHRLLAQIDVYRAGSGQNGCLPCACGHHRPVAQVVGWLRMKRMSRGEMVGCLLRLGWV